MPLFMALGHFSLIFWASTEVPLQEDKYYKSQHTISSFHH